MHLRAVSPHELPDLWPDIRDRIAACCTRSGGKYAPADILQSLIAGPMQLWLAIDDETVGGRAGAIKALAISEIASYPRIKVCKLLACTGEDAGRWIELVQSIEAWARSQGCGAMEPICRPGWERHLKPRGYKRTHVILEKRL